MKQRGHREGSPPNAQDWQWLALTVLCVCLVGLGVAWVAERVGTSLPSPSSVAAQGPVAPPSPPVAAGSPLVLSAPVPVAVDVWSSSRGMQAAVERTIPRAEAVRATVDSLRKHSREDPDAADALPEERIKALEKRFALIN